MTPEEWVEFLKQSIESHDRQLGELVERMDELSGRMNQLAGRVDQTTANIDALTVRLDKMAEVTQLNFDRLTKAMMGLVEHAADHQRRIENLERRTGDL
jgi:methyl-accepting chemotaxis protein